MSQYIAGLRGRVAAFKGCQGFQIRPVVKSQRSLEVDKSQFNKEGWSANNTDQSATLPLPITSGFARHPGPIHFKA